MGANGVCAKMRYKPVHLLVLFVLLTVPILGIQPKELQDHLHSQVLDHSKGVKIDLGEGGLNELLGELVTVRLNMKGFKDVEDHETFKKYLVLMLFHGMGWAKAEKDIIS